LPHQFDRLEALLGGLGHPILPIVRLVVERQDFESASIQAESWIVDESSHHRSPCLEREPLNQLATAAFTNCSISAAIRSSRASVCVLISASFARSVTPAVSLRANR